ncbi:MAG: hypothetical protein HC868_04535 [Sphingomonadales bacterium]|nr:hypothetical protein [Sphingomonadales bacterium]
MLPDNRLDSQQAAVEQDSNPVGHSLDLGKDMRGHEHCALLREMADKGAQLDDLARVEAVRRLVQHEKRGLVQHGLGDRHTLPEAVRQPLDDNIANTGKC